MTQHSFATRVLPARGVLCLFLTAGCGSGGLKPGCATDPVDAAQPRPPKALPLQVVARDPEPGEPVALEGGGDLICAQRFESKRACAGTFGWTLRNRQSGELDDDGYVDEPVVLKLPYDELFDTSGVGFGTVAGTHLVKWFAHTIDKSVEVIPWVGPADSFYISGPSACGVRGDTARCYSLPTCGKTAGDALREGRKEFEFHFPSPITSLASNEKTCVSLEDGTVHCWGEHFRGEDIECVYDRTIQVEGLTDVVSVAPGPQDSVCALRSNGSVLCWGRNSADQFGVSEEDKPFSEVPIAIPGPTNTVRLEGADSGIAALQADGSFYYWGHPIVSFMTGLKGPQKAKLPLPAVDILVVSYGVCAILTDRSVYCAGGRFDRLRDRKGPNATTPFQGLAPWVNAQEYEVAEDFPLIPPELQHLVSEPSSAPQ